MQRLIFISFVTLTILLNSGFFNTSNTARSDSSKIIGRAKLYTFSSDDQYFLGDAQPFVLPSNATLKDALVSLGQDLANNYFSRTYTNKITDIHFEILRIQEISTPSRPLHIALINMVDPDRDAMGYFFQGSTGGQTTFCMLAATFTQPHLAPPLLDGLVMLYNGKVVPELDHINLSGILVPRLVQVVAKRAIHSTKREPVNSDLERVKLDKLKL